MTDLETRVLCATVTEAVPEAESVSDNIAVAAQHLNRAQWSAIGYSSLSQIRRKEALGAACRIRGHMKAISSVVPFHFEGELADKMTLTIADTSADEIRTATIVDDGLVRRLPEMFHSHHMLDFLGCPVTLPTFSSGGKFTGLDYRFLLADVALSDDPLQIIMATPEETLAAEQRVKKLSRKDGALMAYIRDQLIKSIGIRGIEKAPHLDRSLSAVILQSVSDGYDSKRSLPHRLHNLFVGSPAVGKKLLVEAAKILNPVFTEAHPAKISVAGIAGRAVSKDGGWTSEPGLIPQAHRGCFAVQDFHHVPDNVKKEVMGVLSMAMEDGKVIDSTAAKRTHHALTAVHIDMNKHSDVYLSESEGVDSGHARLRDLGLSINVLSRFDFAIEIPRDTERQAEIALDMHDGAQHTARYPSVKAQDAVERQLKVLVAYLRSKYAEVEIPAEVVQYIREKQQALLDENRDRREQLKLLGDFQTRLSNSVDKLIFAIARGNARSVATREDVGKAFEFIAVKMEFLSNIEAFTTPESWRQAGSEAKIDVRRRFIRETFSDTDVTAEEVRAAVCKKFDAEFSASTIRRDLAEVADKREHGKFRVRK